MDKFPIFQELVKKLLDTGKCKSKFTNAIKKFVFNREQINKIDEDILDILVNKYDQDITDIVEKLPPCQALLTVLKKDGNEDKIVEKGIYYGFIFRIEFELSYPKMK